MAYVITQNCCKDQSCVPVCPVDCIRPIGEPGEITGSEMLYIDPVTCIDCNACLIACPVDAIYSADGLPADQERFRDINTRYFERHPLEPTMFAPPDDHEPVAPGSLRVAVVGAGPAACYASTELLRTDGVELNMFERLPTPYGLIRAGVAPDHQNTKQVVHVFERAFTHRSFGCYLNVEIGHHLSHEDLLAHHHAVIYAAGASKSRELGIPGEQLPGCVAAADFVGWYNGHPDHAGHVFDLSSERAVIIGNGDVALDMARILLSRPQELAATDIAQHALDALADSKVREVIILGRRGPDQAGFSVGEFLALSYLPGIDVVIEGHELAGADDMDDVETASKLDIMKECAQRMVPPGGRRIVFRFLASASEIVGVNDVEGIRVQRNTVDANGAVTAADPVLSELIETTLILRSIGFESSAINGLPYDRTRGIVPNDRGRVLDDNGETVPGVYATGWIKRGARGVIGTNRICAQETAAQLWADYDAGRLTRDLDPTNLDDLLTARGAEPVDWRGWRAIDAAEIERGRAQSRPRLKFTDASEMIAAAKR
ncbi:ferredoxin [Mycobacteriaceae bacterium 1482268.1]|nr:ferredoxin [Mycobacteriaceae bacterium 1482268.1]